jgi:hypothetical protein
MNDREILQRIEQLVNEEHELMQRAEGGGLFPPAPLRGREETGQFYESAASPFQGACLGRERPRWLLLVTPDGATLLPAIITGEAGVELVPPGIYSQPPMLLADGLSAGFARPDRQRATEITWVGALLHHGGS